MCANNTPRTLQEAIIYFADKVNALNYMVILRWPAGVTCPHCESKEHSFLSTRRIWKCKGRKKQFSVKVGMIMEDSPQEVAKFDPVVIDKPIQRKNDR